MLDIRFVFLFNVKTENLETAQYLCGFFGEDRICDIFCCYYRKICKLKDVFKAFHFNSVKEFKICSVNEHQIMQKLLEIG